MAKQFFFHVVAQLLYFICFLFVFDFVFVCFLFRIAWWPSAGKELSSSLSACAVLLHVILIVCIPFPFGARGTVWNSIVWGS